MKKLLLACTFLFSIPWHGTAQTEAKSIRIGTNDSEMIFKVADNGRLYQQYFGKKLVDYTGLEQLPTKHEAYITNGMEDYFEPALRMTHADGNPSVLLKYVSHTEEKTPYGTETAIVLRDDKYPVTVTLFYTAFDKENIIKSHAVIVHQEKRPVTLHDYASSMLHFDRESYYMTDFTGDWAREVDMTEQKLEYGKRIVDSKLGSRASMFTSPFFMVSMDGPARENSGEVLLGTIGWTGNFRFTFEVDNKKSLRIISGINPMASEYTLQPNEEFVTPEFYFTLSHEGTGKATRSFHDWARRYQLKDGMKGRMTLLNNWEATYFDFNEEKLIGLFDDAKALGVDMFLLDDGWFGNKYPRHSDTQGLGDWQETADKLPHGIGRLVKEATDKGIKFGIWIEPEMVSPKSELFEKHHDWVIDLPNRDDYYFRNQMVLDLSNPEVQDFVFEVVDGLMTRYPGIAYFKWDCNSPITNIYSPYLKDRQSHLYVDYVKGLYNVLERIKNKYPDLPMMLCSGGGGRSDYEALRYFTEFWPSDNTDPVERLFIQWGYSHFFPAKSLAAHITTWGKQPLKFKLDVAMMCRLGFDIKINELSAEEQQFAKNAVQTYESIKPTVFEGDLYRLVSPYSGNHTATMYVEKDRGKAHVFAFDIHPRYDEQIPKLKLNGLDPSAKYKIKEINLMPGSSSSLSANDKIYSGDYLMTVGLDIFSAGALKSHILELTRQ